MRPEILLLTRDGDLSAILYNHLRRRFTVRQVVIEPPEPLGLFLKRRVRRLGAARVAGQLLFKGLVQPQLVRGARRRIDQICADWELDPTPIDAGLVTRVSSVNDPRTAEVLRAHRHQAVVVFGTRIISKAMLAASPAPFVNVHTGITPAYRGVHGGYWALVQNDLRNCGVTVHLVDEGIDTGQILAQARVEPSVEDNLVSYPYLQLAAGLRLLDEALEGLATPAASAKAAPAAGGRRQAAARRREPPSRATASGSGLWSHPTLLEYVFHRVLHSVK